MNKDIKKMVKELPKAWWRRLLPVVNLDTGEEFPKATENQWLPSVRQDLDRLVERVHRQAYELGARHMWDALEIPPSDYLEVNTVLIKQYLKAQQFIDSLEKDGKDRKEI